jgi:hypothetical protein
VGRNLVMLWVVVPQVGQLVRVHWAAHLGSVPNGCYS